MYIFVYESFRDSSNYKKESSFFCGFCDNNCANILIISFIFLVTLKKKKKKKKKKKLFFYARLKCLLLIVDEPTWQITAPCRCVLAGCSGSGKTYWLLDLLKYDKELVSQKFDTIIWCYGVLIPELLELQRSDARVVLNEGFTEDLYKHLDGSLHTALVNHYFFIVFFAMQNYKGWKYMIVIFIFFCRLLMIRWERISMLHWLTFTQNSQGISVCPFFSSPKIYFFVEMLPLNPIVGQSF